MTTWESFVESLSAADASLADIVDVMHVAQRRTPLVRYLDASGSSLPSEGTYHHRRLMHEMELAANDWLLQHGVMA